MKTLFKVKNPVIYFRGLNSHGDERLRFGLLALGPMFQPWVSQLNSRGIKCIPVIGMGCGSLEQQIENATEFIYKKLSLGSSTNKSTDFKVHFLGHSAGGIIARAVAHHLNSLLPVASILTLSSPHQGSPLAELIEQVPHLRPMVYQLLCSINYDIKKKLPTFSDLTPQRMSQFNERYPDLPHIVYASMAFAVHPEQLTWPVKFSNQMVDHKSQMQENDGFVEVASQKWGKLIYQGSLDHMNQIGYDLSWDLKKRKSHQQEFKTVVEKAIRFWSQVEGYKEDQSLMGYSKKYESKDRSKLNDEFFLRL